jgi:hypothetical protein
VKRIKAQYTYAYEDNIMKPPNTVRKMWEYHEGWSCSKYTVHIDGIITVKPLYYYCVLRLKKKKPSHLTPLHQCLATASWRSLWTQPTSLCVILTILVWPPAAFPLPPCFALACGLSQHQRLLSCFAASFFSATALLLKFLAKSSLTDSYIRSWLISFSGSDLKCPEMH